MRAGCYAALVHIPHVARPFLVRRPSSFYFRARVPADLTTRVGRKEVIRSLRTLYREQAKRRAAVLALSVQQLWDICRMSTTQREIEDLVGRWLKQELDADQDGQGANSRRVLLWVTGPAASKAARSEKRQP